MVRIPQIVGELFFVPVYNKGTNFFYFQEVRRRRDLNPRAAINDLLPFQGSPFNHLGTSPSSILRSFEQRRGWDSNPRALADKRFSRPPRYDHFDTSPRMTPNKYITKYIPMSTIIFYSFFVISAVFPPATSSILSFFKCYVKHFFHIF